MGVPSRTQTAPSALPKMKSATTQHVITGATGIRCDGAGVLDITIGGELVTFNVLQGETPPIRGDFTIEATTTIITQVLY